MSAAAATSRRARPTAPARRRAAAAWSGEAVARPHGGETVAAPTSCGSGKPRREARSVTAWTMPVTSGPGSPTGTTPSPTVALPPRTPRAASSSTDVSSVASTPTAAAPASRSSRTGARGGAAVHPQVEAVGRAAGRRPTAVPAGPSPRPARGGAPHRSRSARRRRAPQRAPARRPAARLPAPGTRRRTAAACSAAASGQDWTQVAHRPGSRSSRCARRAARRRRPASTARRRGSTSGRATRRHLLEHVEVLVRYAAARRVSRPGAATAASRWAPLGGRCRPHCCSSDSARPTMSAPARARAARPGAAAAGTGRGCRAPRGRRADVGRRASTRRRSPPLPASGGRPRAVRARDWAAAGRTLPAAGPRGVVARSMVADPSTRVPVVEHDALAGGDAAQRARRARRHHAVADLARPPRRTGSPCARTWATQPAIALARRRPAPARPRPRRPRRRRALGGPTVTVPVDRGDVEDVARPPVGGRLLDAAARGAARR